MATDAFSGVLSRDGPSSRKGAITVSISIALGIVFLAGYLAGHFEALYHLLNSVAKLYDWAERHIMAWAARHAAASNERGLHHWAVVVPVAFAIHPVRFVKNYIPNTLRKVRDGKR